jgi:hypothetical protein
MKDAEGEYPFVCDWNMKDAWLCVCAKTDAINQTSKRTIKSNVVPVLCYLIANLPILGFFVKAEFISVMFATTALLNLCLRIRRLLLLPWYILCKALHLFEWMPFPRAEKKNSPDGRRDEKRREEKGKQNAVNMQCA